MDLNCQARQIETWDMLLKLLILFKGTHLEGNADHKRVEDLANRAQCLIEAEIDRGGFTWER